MEKAAIRSPQTPSSTNPVARNASARQAAGSEASGAKGGFSLLLADMAAPGAQALPGVATGEDTLAGAELPLATLSVDGLTAVDGLAQTGIFSLTGLASLVGQTARMDGAADAAQRDGRDLPKAEGEGLRRSVALPMGAGQPASAAQLPALAAQQAHGTATSATHATDTAVAPTLADGVADAASTLALPSSERSAQPQALAALLAQMEPEPQPSAFAPAGLPGLAAGQSPANGATPVAGLGSADASAPVAGADTSPADSAADAVLAQPDDAFVDQLSEQVAFWVQQKTQRAEMTIDRQGQPVQVQVAITGNEAHVTFRSNEQQTRDMLAASAAQLREMLEPQGLNLASVTVQTGDAGGQGASSGRDASGQANSGRGQPGPDQTAQVPVDLRARPDARRTVDLFV